MADRPPRPAEEPPSASPALDPASLPMPISRRRLSLLTVGLVVALLVVAFGREDGDAAAASDPAAQLRTTNAGRASELRTTKAGMSSDIADLQADIGRVQGDPYIAIAARSYGLGVKHEIPFV